MQFAPISTYTRTFERNVLIKSFSEEERAQYWEQAQNSFMNPLLAAVCAILEKKEFREFKDIQIHDVPPTEFDTPMWETIRDGASLLINYNLVSGGPKTKAAGGDSIPIKKVTITVSTIYKGTKKTLTFEINNYIEIQENDGLACVDNGVLTKPSVNSSGEFQMKLQFHTMVDQPTTNFALTVPAVLTVTHRSEKF